MDSPKQRLALQRRATAICSATDLITRDQQLVRPAGSQHFDPDQGRRHDDSVRSVHSDSIDGMKVSERLAVIAGEGHVVPNLLDASPRLHSPDHVAMCQVLMLQAHFRASRDADFQ
jgi:hypothetical protein